MLSKHMAVCLVATAFAAAPALAQTSVLPPSGATDRPVATGSGAPVTGSPGMRPDPTEAPQPGAARTLPGVGATTLPAEGAAISDAGEFLTQLGPTQVMASKLIGTTVVSANNESIGDVNDIVLDRAGQAMAVVIGVGGFLSIGEKDVAVPFEELEFASGPMAPAAAGTTAGAGTVASGNIGATGSTTASGDPARSAGAPNRLILRMTKADLQTAPTFRASPGGDDQAGAASAPGAAPGGSPAPGGTTAPRQ